MRAIIRRSLRTEGGPQDGPCKTSGRRQPMTNPAEVVGPLGADPASGVSVEEEVEGLDHVAEAIDPCPVDLVRALALGLGQRGAGDGEGLGLQGQLVLEAVADDNQARLARELARLEGA